MTPNYMQIKKNERAVSLDMMRKVPHANFGINDVYTQGRIFTQVHSCPVSLDPTDIANLSTISCCSLRHEDGSSWSVQLGALILLWMCSCMHHALLFHFGIFHFDFSIYSSCWSVHHTWKEPEVRRLYSVQLSHTPATVMSQYMYLHLFLSNRLELE